MLPPPDRFDVYDTEGNRIGTAEREPGALETILGGLIVFGLLFLFLKYLFLFLAELVKGLIGLIRWAWRHPIPALAVVLGVSAAVAIGMIIRNAQAQSARQEAQTLAAAAQAEWDAWWNQLASGGDIPVNAQLVAEPVTSYQGRVDFVRFGSGELLVHISGLRSCCSHAPDPDYYCLFAEQSPPGESRVWDWHGLEWRADAGGEWRELPEIWTGLREFTGFLVFPGDLKPGYDYYIGGGGCTRYSGSEDDGAFLFSG